MGINASIIGICAGLAGTFSATGPDVGAWIEFFIQGFLAAIGVSLYTRGRQSQGSSRPR